MYKRVFSDFYNKNLPDDIEQAIELFSIFGGLDIEIDTTKHQIDLLLHHIYSNFDLLQNRILSPLHYDNKMIKILTAISRGDRRSHSALKKSKIGSNKGDDFLKELVSLKYINIEYSKEIPLVRSYPKERFKKEIEKHKISHKYRFSYPFMRFWFAFIEPFSDDIKKGDYERSLKFVSTHLNSFIGFTFEELCDIYMRDIFVAQFDTYILQSGSYWDKDVEIDLFCTTADDDIFIGECKWTNHKVNKKELRKLNEKIELLDIKPDKIVLFSKRGFSNELLKEKQDDIYLINSNELLNIID